MTDYRTEHNQSLWDGNRMARTTKQPCVYCGRPPGRHIHITDDGPERFQCKPHKPLGKKQTPPESGK